MGFVLGENTLTPTDLENLLLFAVKVLFLFGSLLYVVFAFLVVRQVHVMKNTLITNFSPVLLFLAYLHLIFAIGVAIIFWLIL